MNTAERCECGLAGTCHTPDGLCALCGKPLNQESVAWLARELGRQYRNRARAVEPSASALELYRLYMEAAAADGYVERRLLRDGLRQILEVQVPAPSTDRGAVGGSDA